MRAPRTLRPPAASHHRALSPYCTRQGRKRRASRTLGVTLGASLIALAACGRDTPEGATAIQTYSQVGDCLRPDPATLEGFLQADCDSPDASVEIVEMVRDGSAESSPVCPSGTDLLVDGEQGPVVDGDIAAVPQTWCLRNLEAPHPGDPGQGGGELVPRDCFAVDAAGEISESACDGRGRTAPEHRLLSIEEAGDDCPDGATDPIELNAYPPRVLCAAEL
jgi:hypothetical protein